MFWLSLKGSFVYLFIYLFAIEENQPLTVLVPTPAESALFRLGVRFFFLKFDLIVV